MTFASVSLRYCGGICRGNHADLGEVGRERQAGRILEQIKCRGNWEKFRVLLREGERFVMKSLKFGLQKTLSLLFRIFSLF